MPQGIPSQELTDWVWPESELPGEETPEVEWP